MQVRNPFRVVRASSTSLNLYNANRNFDPEYRMVAAGWNKLPNKSLFFGVLDFKLGQAVFQKFGMSSAPSVLFFPLGSGQNDRYDFGKRWVQKNVPKSAFCGMEQFVFGVTRQVTDIVEFHSYANIGFL